MVATRVSTAESDAYHMMTTSSPRIEVLVNRVAFVTVLLKELPAKMESTKSSWFFATWEEQTWPESIYESPPKTGHVNVSRM